MDPIKLEQVLLDQAEEFNSLLRKTWLHRPEEDLVDLTSDLAQCVIGVRRSGKSILCINVIKNANLPFAYVNFEDEQLISFNSDDLNIMLERLYKIYGDFNHIFLDEIQDVDGWQHFVNRLLRKGMHVLMTGSNAKLLSSELATHLTGRHMKIELYPFSFSEYCEARQITQESGTTRERGLLSRAFSDYLHEGGFPELLKVRRKDEYINSLVTGILENDIEKRFRILYKESFERLAHHLMNTAPAKLNATGLCKLFDFNSVHTLKNYVSYLEKGYLMCRLPKYSSKSKVRVTGDKMYPIDVALMNRRKDAFAPENLGWRLECIVFIELLRRFNPEAKDLAYYEDNTCECDFLVCSGLSVEMAVQVSYDISKGKTFNREVKGLIEVSRKTGCNELLLITDHDKKEIQIEGKTIQVIPAYEWLTTKAKH